MSSPTVWCFFLLSICTVCLVPGERLFIELEGGREALAREETSGSQLTSWSLFGKGGHPGSDDVKGESPHCHYLAGLATIAEHYPELIEEAFTMRGETSPSGAKVYQVKFLIDGIETLVAMDEQVPTFRGKSGSELRLASVARQAVWPVLLEKGLAKLSGSYAVLLKGLGHEPLTALTQAPVDFFRTWYNPLTHERTTWLDQRMIAKYLRRASKQKFLVVARCQRWFLEGRAMFLVEATRDSVHLLDPVDDGSEWGLVAWEELNWRKGDWNGVLYKFSWAEFWSRFERVDIANVLPGHRLSLVRIPVGEPVALKFTITKRHAAVQLEWPTERLTSAQGRRLGPGNAKLLVRTGDQEWSGTRRQLPELWNLRVDLSAPGTYFVYAYFSFSGMPVTSEVAVSVYAGQDVTLERLSDPLAVGREILGFPCTFLVGPRSGSSAVDDVYEAVPFPLGGSPAWKKRGAKTVLWHNGTSLTRSSSIDELDQMAEDIALNELECGPEGSYGESPEDKVEQTEEVKQRLCGWQIGDQLLYQDEKGSWICSEVVALLPDYKDRRAEDRLQLSHRLEDRVFETLCSAPLKRVSPCQFSKFDQVEFRRGQEWVGDQVAGLGCGEVTLLKGGKRSCEKDQLRHSCTAYKDEEEVSVWDDELKQWHFAEAKDVNSSQVTVLYKGKTLGLPCGDNDRLRKVSKCDKVAREQIERLTELYNIDEVWTDGRDSVFPAEESSIGETNEVNTWGRISDILS